MTFFPGEIPVVLVVDDDAQARNLLKRFLERDGFRILEAKNGEEALRLAETITPDLVLLDIQMPLMDGIQACAEFRKRPETSLVPILMLTGMVDEGSIERSFAVGATDYLTKPVNPSALRFRVARLIGAYRADRQLRETEGRIQSVVRHASDAIITLDQSLKVISANPSAERLFDCPATDLTQRTISDLIALDLTKLTETSVPVETEIRLSTARRKAIEVTSGDFISNGKLFYTLIIRDISERKKAENQLRNSQLLLQSTLDTLSAHIAILDRDGTILAVNEAWKRFARDNGLPDGKFGVGINYLRLCEQATGPESDEARAFANGVRQVIQGKRESFRLEYPCHGPQEKRWFVAQVANFFENPLAPVVIAHEDSTDQHVAQERLRQANQFMSRVIEAIPDGIGVIDARGRIRFVNRNLSRITGAHQSEVFEKRFAGFISRRSRGTVREAVRRLHRLEAEVEEVETSLRRKDGCFVPVRLSLARVAEDNTILAIVEDLTERKALAEVLRRRDEEWVATVDAIPDFILLEDTSGILRRCNSAVAEFLGQSYRNLIGYSTVELFFPGQSLERKTIRAAIGERQEFQFPGSDRWFEISSYWIPQERGIGTGWVHIIKDITNRRQADRAMRRLTTAIEQIAESVVMLDGRGQIQYVNPAFEKATGVHRWEAYERKVFKLSLGPVQTAVRKEIIRTLLGGREWHGIYTARRKNGGMYQEEASISPVWDESGRLQNIVAVCRDVTEQLRYESIAEAVNVMDTAGYIFSGIRHEMGNPINSIKTALTVLSRTENPSPETVSKYLDRSLTEIGRVEYLLRTLRSFSMFETPALEPLPIIPFLERFCSLIEEDFQKRGIRIERIFDADAGIARFDQRGLHQALLNLFTNAADALKGIEHPTITLQVSRGDRLISVIVADNGIGLTPQQAEQLFKPFFTSKPHGTGLGLVITKKLITKMNGTVELRSGLTRGCEAIVTLEAIRPENHGGE
jgi:PAS domain S-box-containing protein